MRELTKHQSCNTIISVERGVYSNTNNLSKEANKQNKTKINLASKQANKQTNKKRLCYR